MGGRKGKALPRRPGSLEQSRRAVTGLQQLLHTYLEGLGLPTDDVGLITALQELDDGSDLVPLTEDAYYATIYLELARDQLDPLNSEPDLAAAIAHVALAASFVFEVPTTRERIAYRRFRSAAASPGGTARKKKYEERRLALTPEIKRRLFSDPGMPDSQIADQLLSTDPGVRKSTLRRWIRERRKYHGL